LTIFDIGSARANLPSTPSSIHQTGLAPSHVDGAYAVALKKPFHQWFINHSSIFINLHQPE